MEQVMRLINNKYKLKINIASIQDMILVLIFSLSVIILSSGKIQNKILETISIYIKN
jgi:hypothetical protein